MNYRRRENASSGKRMDSRLTDWFRVQKISKSLDGQLRDLHLDEAEVIAIVEDLNAARVIFDEKQGRRIAPERGLNVIGRSEC